MKSTIQKFMPRNALRSAIGAAVACTAATFALPASAEIFSVEGTNVSIEVTRGTTAAPTEVEVNCAGVQVTVNAATFIVTPTGPITMAQLVDKTNLAIPGTLTGEGKHPMYVPASNPAFWSTTSAGAATTQGANRQGFVGGTCIADGDDISGVTLAYSLQVEPGENVLIGRITGQDTAVGVIGNPIIKGVTAVAITDPRMPGTRPRAGMYTMAASATRNADDTTGWLIPSTLTDSYKEFYGFGIAESVFTSMLDPANAIGVFGAAAAGFLSPNGRFYFFDLETTVAPTIPATGTSPINSPTVLRASLQGAGAVKGVGAGKDSLDLRGGCLTAASGPGAPKTINVWYEAPTVTATGTTYKWYRVTAGTNPTALGTAGSTNQPGLVLPTLTCTPDLIDAPRGQWRLGLSKMTFQGNRAPRRFIVNMEGTTVYDFAYPRVRTAFLPAIA
jgi:hypothetical protein